VTLSCSIVLFPPRMEPRNRAYIPPHCLSCSLIRQCQVSLYLQLAPNDVSSQYGALTETVNDRFDLRVVDSLSVPLPLDELQDCLHDMLLGFLEHLLPPSDQV